MNTRRSFIASIIGGIGALLVPWKFAQAKSPPIGFWRREKLFAAVGVDPRGWNRTTTQWETTVPWDDEILKQPGWIVAEENHFRTVRVELSGCDISKECFAANSSTGEFGCYVGNGGVIHRDENGKSLKVLRRGSWFAVEVIKK